MILSSIIAIIIIPILSGFKYSANSIDQFYEKYPKRIFTYSVILNSLIALIYLMIITTVARIYVYDIGANIWVIFVLSCFWCISLISKADLNQKILLTTCLFPFIALWLFGDIASIAVWLIIVIYFITKTRTIIDK